MKLMDWLQLFILPAVILSVLSTKNESIKATSILVEQIEVLDPIPFDCAPSFYQTINSNGLLLQYDTDSLTLGFDTIAIYGTTVNATGYNSLDNFIYSISYNNNHLIRFHSDGTFTDLGAINFSPQPQGNVYAGGFDDQGRYFVKAGGSRIYEVNINDLSTTSFTTNPNFEPYDWAYSVTLGNFYGVRNNTLYCLNPTAQTVTTQNIQGFSFFDGNFYGGAFATASGDVYVVNNDTGNVYRIDISTGQAHYITTGPTGLSPNDGGACLFAESPFPEIFALNDTLCLSLDGEGTAMILENDSTYLTDLDLGNFEIITSPSNGSVSYDDQTGEITYTANGTPQADFFEYEICGTSTLLVCGQAGVTIFPAPTVELNEAICNGEMYDFFGNTLTETGEYQELLSTNTGCDSLVVLNLVVNNSETTPITAAICAGSSYDFFGNMLTEAGEYEELLNTTTNCDSVVVLTLTVNDVFEMPITATICEGTSYDFFGNILTEAGEYQELLSTNTGCDSLIILSLTTTSSPTTQLVESICAGESITIGNTIFNETGIYTETLTTAVGCDSIIELNLTVLEDTEAQIVAEICAGESINVGNSTYSATGNYTDIIQNVAGCDSTIFTDLTVHLPNTTLIDLTTCESSEVGVQTSLLTNQFGCDSTVTVTTILLSDNACFVAADVEGSFLYCQAITGTISVNITVGTAPFLIEWTGASAGTQTVNNLNEITILSGLNFGEYSIIISDTNQNSTTLLATIVPAIPPVLSVTTAMYNDYEISCNGGIDGSATATTIDGTPPYTYLWNTDETTATIENLAAGTYTVTVTDATNCEEITTIELIEPEPLALTFAVSALTCFDAQNGAIEALVSGGQSPYSYALNGGNNQSNAIFSNLAAGTYEITVTDANGCTTSEIIWLNAPLPIDVYLGENMTINLGENAELNALVNIPTSALDTVFWSNLDDVECPTCLEQIISPIVTTTYSVQVESNLGCTAVDELTITVDKSVRIYAPNVFSPNDDGLNDVFILYADHQHLVEIKELKIYSRWGELLYERYAISPNNELIGWDGRHKGIPLNPAVFVWYAVVELFDGSEQMVKGDVTLIR